MCTLTWLPAVEGGYDLFFNRDELDLRAPEIPPEILQHEGIRLAAPRDGEHGGTWLAMNPEGLTVALLNYYPPVPPRPPPLTNEGVVDAYTTRGLLPWLAGCTPTAAALEKHVRGKALTRYRPFYLVAVDAAGGNRLFRWDGDYLEVADAPPCVTSSSHDSATIEATRVDRFNRLPNRSVETLHAFHRDHRTDHGASSVCMRRADGRTRSITAVHVRADVKELVYEQVPWDTPPRPPWRVRF